MNSIYNIYNIYPMTMEYRFQLDSPRVTGRRQQKTTCPRCGRPKCFVRYVDTHNGGQYLNDAVGRCDHELSCGYIYSPADYFRDHPWLNEKPSPAKPIHRPTPPLPKVAEEPALVPLPTELPSLYHSTQSTFWLWFATLCTDRLRLPADRLPAVYDAYRIGAWQGRVIFWQIDEQQRVRSGEVMDYTPDGHRTGQPTWVHSLLERRGRLPQGFQLRQCLFGQHLLPHHAQQHVCIVESQKTALVMAALQPQYVWLATCGCHGLRPERLDCLQGRRVTLFPDAGCYTKWLGAMRQTQGISYNVDSSMEHMPPNTDLVDMLLQKLSEANPEQAPQHPP